VHKTSQVKNILLLTCAIVSLQYFFLHFQQQTTLAITQAILRKRPPHDTKRGSPLFHLDAFLIGFCFPLQTIHSSEKFAMLGKGVTTPIREDATRGI